MKRKQDSPVYSVWRNIKKRCYGENKDSKNYRDKNITMSDAWLNDFWQFESDMGHRPEGFTIERKDNNKGYNKDNCIWGNRELQSRNRSNTISIELVTEIKFLNKLGYFSIRGNQSKFAKENSLSKSLVSRVVIGKTWA